MEYRGIEKTGFKSMLFDVIEDNIISELFQQ